MLNNVTSIRCGVCGVKVGGRYRGYSRLQCYRRKRNETCMGSGCAMAMVELIHIEARKRDGGRRVMGFNVVAEIREYV